MQSFLIILKRRASASFRETNHIRFVLHVKSFQNNDNFQNLWVVILLKLNNKMKNFDKYYFFWDLGPEFNIRVAKTRTKCCINLFSFSDINLILRFERILNYFSNEYVTFWTPLCSVSCMLYIVLSWGRYK